MPPSVTHDIFSALEAALYIADEMVDQLPLILTITNETGHILKVNAECQYFFKKGPKNLLGKPFDSIVGKDASHFFKQYFLNRSKKKYASFLENRASGMIFSWKVSEIQTYYNSLKKFYMILGSDNTNLINMQTSMAAAKVIQTALLPKNDPSPEIEISTYYQAAEDAGGDFYDYFYNESQKRLYVIIGDVNGHGIPAAMMTGTIIGAFKGLLAGFQNIDELKNQQCTLEKLANAINTSYRFSSTRTNLLASMALICLDTKTGVCSYLNAGHPMMFKVEKNSVKSILKGGSLIGFEDKPKFGTAHFNLEPEEFLFLYTDGLIENSNKEGKTLSPKMIKSYLDIELSLTEQINTIIQRGVDIWGTDGINDDVATIMIRRKKA